MIFFSRSPQYEKPYQYLKCTSDPLGFADFLLGIASLGHFFKTASHCILGFELGGNVMIGGWSTPKCALLKNRTLHCRTHKDSLSPNWCNSSSTE